jgi:hypothetical protein
MIKQKFYLWTLYVIYFLLIPVIAHGAFESVDLGARPLAMGSAFVAIADDSNAIFWNPGGLPQIRHRELTMSYMELYDLVSYSSLGFAQSTKLGTIGAGLVSSSDIEGVYYEMIMTLSAGKKLYKDLSFGASVKYNYSSANLDNLKIGSGKGFSLDTGLQYCIRQDLVRIGVAFQNLAGYISYDRGNYKDIPGEKYRERPGFSYKTGVSVNLSSIFPKLDKTFVNAELSDNHIHAGAEYTFRDILSLRAGFQTGNALNSAITMGFGLKLQSIRLDYAYIGSQFGANTSQFSVSMKSFHVER